MSIATVVTRGYGSHGNSKFVVVRGYGDYGALGGTYIYTYYYPITERIPIYPEKKPDELR